MDTSMDSKKCETPHKQHPKLTQGTTELKGANTTLCDTLQTVVFFPQKK